MGALFLMSEVLLYLAAEEETGGAERVRRQPDRRRCSHLRADTTVSTRQQIVSTRQHPSASASIYSMICETLRFSRGGRGGWCRVRAPPAGSMALSAPDRKSERGCVYESVSEREREYVTVCVYVCVCV